MSDKFFVGLDLTGIEDNGLHDPISRVTLLLDDENSVTAGDDTGGELLADCPYATPAIANAILAQVKGYQYHMFSAEDAGLDPSAELGDGVTAGGIYSVISRLSDDGSGYLGVTAPGKAEMEEEYPTSGPMTVAFDRKIAQTRSSITKTAEQITLLVEDQVEGLEGKLELTASSLRSEIVDKTEGLSSKIEQTASSLTSRIDATNGRVSSIEQYVDGITLSVSNGSTSSTIALKSGSATIASQTIRMDGLVTFTGLQSGTTTIDGACIKTGLISAERLNLTGAITWGDLAYDAQGQVVDAQDAANSAKSTADAALSTAHTATAMASAADTTVRGWTYQGTTYIDGNQLMTGTVKASTLQGGSIYLLDYYGSHAGSMTLSGASSAGYAVDIASYGAMRLTAQYGDVYIYSEQYGHYLWLSNDGVYVNNTFASRNVASLGNSTFPWNDVYAHNATIQTSDLTRKKDVRYGLEDYEALFDALRPMSFVFMDGESGRRHLGMGAQDVEEAMDRAGLSSLDFAGFIKTERSDGAGSDYALRYGEFIPLCIEQIQHLKARVAELERRMA